MSPSRQTSAMQPPPVDVKKFPRRQLLSGRVIYRAHKVGYSPWWFSSDQSGRFDLTPPNGTCYLATDSATALRERFGHALVKQGVVSYLARFSTGVQSRAIALFDRAGQRPWSEDPSPMSGVQACADAGIRAQHPPTPRQVRIITPPAAR